MQHNKLDKTIRDGTTDQTLLDDVAILAATIHRTNPTREQLFEVFFTVSSKFFPDEKTFTALMNEISPYLQMYQQRK